MCNGDSVYCVLVTVVMCVQVFRGHLARRRVAEMRERGGRRRAEVAEAEAEGGGGGEGEGGGGAASQSLSLAQLDDEDKSAERRR